MPIIVQGKQLDVKALAEALEAKKKSRPKYSLNTKTTEQEYEDAKIVIGGEEKKLSKSSSFLLDQLTDDSK